MAKAKGNLKYTDNDHEFIKANIHMTDMELGLALGRTFRSVSNYRRRKGIYKWYNASEGRTIKLTQQQRYEIGKSRLSPKVLSDIYGVTARYIRKVKQSNI